MIVEMYCRMRISASPVMKMTVANTKKSLRARLYTKASAKYTKNGDYVMNVETSPSSEIASRLLFDKNQTEKKRGFCGNYFSGVTTSPSLKGIRKSLKTIDEV